MKPVSQQLSHLIKSEAVHHPIEMRFYSIIDRAAMIQVSLPIYVPSHHRSAVSLNCYRYKKPISILYYKPKNAGTTP